MDEPQSFPLWLIPAFPVFFVALWLFVCVMISEIGGWSELARHYREPEGIARAPIRTFRTTSLGLRRGWFPLPANYNNCVVADVTATGLHLRTWLPFRFRHPPLFIPWTQLESARPGRILFFRTLVLKPGGVGTRIHLFGDPARAVEQVLTQFFQAAPQPAGV